MISELRGVNFRPASAKEVVKNLEVGDECTLERDAENQYDPNAIRVISDDGEWIGFVAKEDAADLAPLMDEGEEFTCSVETRTGTYGILLSIERMETDSNAEDDAA